MLYDDGRIALDDEGLTISHYYLWGSKRLAYSSIRSVKRHPLTPVGGKWRIWGSGDLVHWWNLDPERRRKATALELDVGGRVRPMITPDDPDEVERLLNERLLG